MYQYPITIEVETNEQPLREYQHDGKVYVAGDRQTPYRVRLKNYAAQRILAVCTVDGLSVMDGQPVDHRVTATSFRRPASPAAVVTLYYDTKDNLRARGVPVDGAAAPVVPQAFPASHRYCAPPVGWTG